MKIAWTIAVYYLSAWFLFYVTRAIDFPDNALPVASSLFHVSLGLLTIINLAFLTLKCSFAADNIHLMSVTRGKTKLSVSRGN